jgi:hypothetical protein
MTAAPTWNLQGSAASLEALAGLIRARWYWETVHIEPTAEPGVFTVASGKGVNARLRVVLKKGRYRLEIRA